MANIQGRARAHDRLLTESDFNGPIPKNYFACIKCHAETNVRILRHRKHKYVVQFRCLGPTCQRFKPWYKCRVCCRLNECFLRPDRHIKTYKHQEQVKYFEASKPESYVIHENLFLDPTSSCNHVQTTATRPTNADNNVNDTGSCLHEDHTIADSLDETSNYCDGELESMSFEADDEDQLDVESPMPPMTPQTVNEWKKLLISKSPEPVEDFASYFPTKTETIGEKTKSPSNRDYYRSNFVSGHGPRVLYSQTIIQNSQPTSISEASPVTTLWCMLLAMLSSRMTRTDQRILLALLTHMNERKPEDPPLPVPIDHAMLRRRYIEGAKSISNLLPRPIIQSLDNGFVYVPIRDILQFHLANGQSIDPLLELLHMDQDGKQKLKQTLHGSSPRGKTLLKFKMENTSATDKFPAEVIIWSDGFDANNTKNNRGSTHVILISIGTPEDDYHSGCNTYPVSIGPADGDLTQVARLIADELKALSETGSEFNVYFDGDSKKEISVFLLVYCLLQDRPERCHWLSLAYGNGKYAGRFGWAGDMSQSGTFDIFGSCNTCHEQRLRNSIPSGSCQHCRDWSMKNLLYKVPDNYPTAFFAFKPSDGMPDSVPRDRRLLLGDSWYLPFTEITFDVLEKAIKSAYDMVRLGVWKKNEGVAYLETFALSPDYIKEICKAADTGMDQPPLPASWDIPGVDIKHHIDVPMHLLFLGITKANSADLIEGWLKSKRQSTSFYKKSHPVLRTIKKLTLSWCKAETKFGGYVSENWIAYLRLSKFINQLISNRLAASDEVYTDPPDVEMSHFYSKAGLALCPEGRRDHKAIEEEDRGREICRLSFSSGRLVAGYL